MINYTLSRPVFYEKLFREEMRIRKKVYISLVFNMI